MVSQQPAKQTDHRAQQQILDRIARRFEQLDQRLAELEDRLQQLDSDDQSDTFRPRQPR